MIHLEPTKNLSGTSQNLLGTHQEHSWIVCFWLIPNEFLVVRVGTWLVLVGSGLLHVLSITI